MQVLHLDVNLKKLPWKLISRYPLSKNRWELLKLQKRTIKREIEAPFSELVNDAKDISVDVTQARS